MRLQKCHRRAVEQLSGPGLDALTCFLEVLSVAAEVKLGDGRRQMCHGRLHMLFSELEAPGEIQFIQSA